MIDALGVRGIWRGTDGQEDTRALDSLNAAIQTALGMKFELPPSSRSSCVDNFGLW